MKCFGAVVSSFRYREDTLGSHTTLNDRHVDNIPFLKLAALLRTMSKTLRKRGRSSLPLAQMGPRTRQTCAQESRYPKDFLHPTESRIAHLVRTAIRQPHVAMCRRPRLTTGSSVGWSWTSFATIATIRSKC